MQNISLLETKQNFSNKANLDSISDHKKLPFSYNQTGFILATIEFFIIISLSIISHISYSLIAFGNVGDLDISFGVGILCAFLYVFFMEGRKLYEPSMITQSEGIRKNVIFTWLFIFCSMITAAFLLKISWNFSRGSLIFLFTSGLIILSINRMLVARFLRFLIFGNYLAHGRRVVLLGDIQQISGRNIPETLGLCGYHVTEQFGISTEPNGNRFKNLRQIATPIELMKTFIRENRVDEILLVFSSKDQRLVEMVSDRLREIPLPTKLLVDQYTSELLNRPVAAIGSSKAIELQGGPLNYSQQTMKRIFDVSIALLGLVVLAPIFLIIALLIKLDSPGPVMFRQRRAGFNGRTFEIFKFRSMVTLDDEADIKQATKNDKRVTRIGRWLRKSSLDELPQLLNVLQGNMSIVGPRPHALSHDSKYNDLIATYALRHHVKPGITGWAQVHGYRGETSTLKLMEARVEHDLWYIKHWNMKLDFQTIYLTILHILRPKNVY
jgi:Undecaprenyl-phosphate glucose phosphotransferase